MLTAEAPGAIPESTHDGNTEPVEVDVPPSERKTLEVPALNSLLEALRDDCQTGHNELKSDVIRWEGLVRVGFVRGTDGDPSLELRNCPRCKSTICKEMR